MAQGRGGASVNAREGAMIDLAGQWVSVIFLDGRALPEDPTPSWKGYSVGRWG
jgi:hypothetical protein